MVRENAFNKVTALNLSRHIKPAFGKLGESSIRRVHSEDRKNRAYSDSRDNHLQSCIN